MIHFASSARITFFNSKLLPILLNLSMWSNRTATDVTITHIHDTLAGHRPDQGRALSVILTADESGVGVQRDLAGYLQRALPDSLRVGLASGQVHVLYNTAPPAEQPGKV